MVPVWLTLCYCTRLTVIFRDLKPENVGFTASGKVKIFDFGVARDLVHVQRVGDKLGFTGTPRYMANEVVAGMDYSLPADVYSFGILLHQICTLRRPFANLQDMESFRTRVVTGGERPKLSLIKSTKLRSLIGKCWDPVPDRRPTFTEIRTILESFVNRAEAESRPIKRSLSGKGSAVTGQTEPPSTVVSHLENDSIIPERSLFARRWSWGSQKSSTSQDPVPMEL
jgi:serine/threonine protein kinase